MRPEYPEAFDHLHRWAYELHGRSGISPSGDLAPLSPVTIAAWAWLKCEPIEPYEVDALMMLDAILLNPESGVTKAPDVVAAPKSAWPTKKPEAV